MAVRVSDALGPGASARQPAAGQEAMKAAAGRCENATTRRSAQARSGLDGIGPRGGNRAQVEALETTDVLRPARPLFYLNAPARAPIRRRVRARDCAIGRLADAATSPTIVGSAQHTVRQRIFRINATKWPRRWEKVAGPAAGLHEGQRRGPGRLRKPGKVVRLIAAPSALR